MSAPLSGVTERYFEGMELPLVIEPGTAGMDLNEWAEANQAGIEEKLLEHGALLFRGFGITDIENFERFIAASSGEALEYKERSSPRHEQGNNVYTSTDYPARYPIYQHNESSYAKTFPMRLLFYCHIQPAEGGETPIANSRRVYERVPAEIRDRFIEKKVLYVRNFSASIGLPWQTVFQTSDKEEVGRYCEKAGYEYEWLDGDRLRTRRIGQVVAKHPKTGEMTWFNHATFFHVSTLVPAIRDALLMQFEEEELPNNTYYGDGTPIEPEVLEQLRAIYDEETVMFPWQQGDVMLMDNLLASHGRSPFKGERKIIAGMAQPMTAEQLEYV